MMMQKNADTTTDIVNNVKNAINTRKYTHADEISLLWQHAMKSPYMISWGHVMLIALIVAAIITVISTLFF
ncbi:3-oxoacyl-ACP synthase [Providencia alcalifaciens]|uniref:3-oxoacyl-ACP synthase n=1 Tax=Providencia alcalifaciens TaxID=126385 RepID=UPI0032DACE02